MNEERKLSAKETQVSFHFNDQTSSYQSKLTLSNLSQQPLYYRMVSTFGKLLTYQNHHSRRIQPSKVVILSLKLKISNQIKINQEKIQVSYSRKEISSKMKFFDDEFFDVGMRFQQNVPEQNEMITQILKEDCEELCQQSAQLIKTGFIKKALYKYQESFLLYRQHGDGLYGMAECQYLMLAWNEALDHIQTALLMHQNQNYLWLKLKIVFQIYREEPHDLQMIRTLKKQINNLTAIENGQEKKKEMLEYLQKQEEKIVQEKGGKITYEFIEKALGKYQTDPHLKTLYKSFDLYEQQVLQVLGMRKPHTIQQTPEFVLDPITYVILPLIPQQIMNQPLIVPSGHSFEQKSLLSYMSKHGNKDLFTRQELRYEWARPNNALQKFIQSNSHLQQWISYEQEITTFK